jgi:hypothetical protein
MTETVGPGPFTPGWSPLRLDPRSPLERRAAADALQMEDMRDLLGMLLVDGSLKTYPTPSGGYVQLSLVAGLGAINYLEEKAELLRRVLPTRADITTISGRRAGGRSSTQLRLRVSTNRLRPIYNLLYPGGEREITRNALEMLGGKAAGWVWAEGVRWRSDGSAYLRRVGQTSYEACLIGGWLELLTGATSRLSESARLPQLDLGPTDAAKAAQVLLPYAPQSRSHCFAQPAEVAP